jgi:sec-independent protein translocase protein TatA
MLGLDNPLHIAFILVLLLLVFGAKRLPELGKSLGSGLRGFKESISGDDTAAELTATHTPVRVDEMPREVHVVPAPAPASQPVAAPTADPVAERVADRTPVHPAA